MSEVRCQRIEDRGQKADVRGQGDWNSECGRKRIEHRAWGIGQKTEVRRQITEDRCQRIEDRGQKADVRGQGDWNSEL